MRRLRSWAAARPHLYLVEEPAGTAARLAVERFARQHAWPLVETPADADLLVLVGPPGGVEPYADRVYDQLPGPRARVRVVGAEDVPAELEAARRQLLDPSMQRADVRPHLRPPAGMPAGEDMSGMASHDMSSMADHDMSGMADHDMSGMADADMSGHAGHDMGGMADHDMSGMADADMSGHAGHDMGGMEMPAGLAMADRAEDRDGLKLDVLTVPWGPALPWWPPGLIVTTVLQGDVLHEVRVERVGQAAGDGWAEAVQHLDDATAAVVRRLDALVRLLGVAGWDAPRLTAQRLRDDLLDGAPLAARAGQLRRLAQRVGRSRALARMSSGLPLDVVARYRGWLDDVVAAADGGAAPTAPTSIGDLDLTRALQGMELGTARLMLAALDLELAAAHREVAGV